MAQMTKLEKAKEWFNRDKQRVITYLAYVLIIAVSVLASTLSVVFGIGDNFDGSRFITNLCLNIAFSIIALILAWKDGEMASDQRKSGTLYEMKQMFNQTVRLIVDNDGFRQWNDMLYERERKDYITTQLANVQIFDYEYLLISDKDLYSLCVAPRDDIQLYTREKGKIETISLDQITEYQLEIINVFRKGEFKFPKIPYTFFKSQENTNSYKKFASEADKNRHAKIWTLVYRVVMIVIFSVIFALAIINPNKSNTSQIIFDTISRIFNMVSSMFMGYSLARDEAVRLRDSLAYKVGVINDYITDIETGTFIPMNRTEEINMKIKERREKLKLEEARKEQLMLEQKKAEEKPKEKVEPDKPKKEEKEEFVEVEIPVEDLK